MVGDAGVLSVDQVLRLICIPAVVVAFLIASQISSALAPSPTAAEMARE
jgi:hypothetical protein